jgi:hypothetical protein
LDADEAFQHAVRPARAAGDRRVEPDALVWLMISAWSGRYPPEKGSPDART